MLRPRAIDDERVRTAQRWFDARTITEPVAAPTVADRNASVAVVIPARNEARTIGAICTSLTESKTQGLFDELIVIDCASSDRTAQIAELAGAQVHRIDRILPEIPSVIGKGEALWRSLAAVDSDIVCFVDGDIRNFDPMFIERLITPLLRDETLSFTKGFYRRPLRIGSTMVPAAGGRVTELTARPLLNLCYPELAGFLQPLAGEMAARTNVLRSVPFFTGYGVDVALLIDIAAHAGLDSMAQVDLEERVHRNRPLRELRAMATVIARAILSRAERDERLAISGGFERAVLLPGSDGSLDATDLVQLERPPMNRLGESSSEKFAN
jgi:glucosyl-3-phosphoglycerate synthase